MPSKSLLAAAELVHGIRHTGRFGVRATVEPVDLAAVMGHVRDVQAQVAPHDSVARLRSVGVEVITGTGRSPATGSSRPAAGRCASARPSSRPDRTPCCRRSEPAGLGDAITVEEDRRRLTVDAQARPRLRALVVEHPWRPELVLRP